MRLDPCRFYPLCASSAHTKKHMGRVVCFLVSLFLSLFLPLSLQQDILYPEIPLPNTTTIASKQNGYNWTIAIIGGFSFYYSYTGPCILLLYIFIIIFYIAHTPLHIKCMHLHALTNTYIGISEIHNVISQSVSQNVKLDKKIIC
jgi:hypothetical protein